MARRRRTLLWVGAALVAVAAGWAYRQFDLGTLLTLEQLKAGRDALVEDYDARPVLESGVAHAPQCALRWLKKFHDWQRT
jgi:hypothetical protein